MKSLKDFRRLAGLGLSILLGCLLFFACKSIPVASSSDKVDYAKVLYERATYAGSDYLSGEHIDFTYNDGEIRNFKVNMYIHKGHFIFASVSLLGFELLRLEISPDSIKYINRIEKEFIFERIDFLDKITGLNLSYFELESLITNGLIIKRSDSWKRFKSGIVEYDEEYKISYIGSNTVSVNSFFSKPYFIEKRIEIQDLSSDFSLFAELSDYFPENVYPSLLLVKFYKGDSFTEIKIRIGKIGNNKPSNRSFTINSKYREIEF